MQNKNKAPKITINSLNRILGTIAFVLVFIFTTLLMLLGKLDKKYNLIVLSVMLPIIGLVIIAWIVLFLIIRNRNKKKDPNQQNIKKALESIEEQNKDSNNEHNS